MRGERPQGRNAGVNCQRNQQQKADGKHQRERKHPLLDEINKILQASPLSGRNFPNGIERVSKLDQHSGRAEKRADLASRQRCEKRAATRESLENRSVLDEVSVSLDPA